MSTITDLTNLLRKADTAYYEQNTSIMSDAEYDKLAREFEKLTGEKWMTLGAPSEQLTRVPHVVPMLSLEKVTDTETLASWFPREGIYVITPKIDGVSCALRYRGGVLTAALSRGDGTVGESVLHALQLAVQAGHIPARLTDPDLQGDVEIRGEVYIPIELFPQVGGANPRNSAAGLLRRQQVDPRQKYLRFAAYRILGVHYPLYTSQLGNLLRAGFSIPPHEQRTDKALQLRTLPELHPDTWAGILEYEIDGAVIALNDIAAREALGETSKYPRWACAVKFETDEAETTLLDIEWTANRTGVVVPTYVFTAVHLCGTVVNRATGHNFEQLQKLGAAQGSRIIVKKANEIIPRVDRLAPCQGAHAVKIEHPQTCPACASQLVVKMPHLWCVNAGCSEKLVGLLVHTAKRSNLDINGLGDEVAAAIADSGLARNIADLFTLTEGPLADMPFAKGVFGGVRAKKLIGEINKARTKPWNVVLHSLGCPGLGEPECDLIAARFSLFDMINSMSPTQLKLELIGMKGIGEKTAVTFVEWMRMNCEWLFELLDHVQTVPAPVDTSPKPLAGYTVALTGNFSQPRGGYEKRLKALGATVSGSVSKATTYLVTGEDSEGTSKHQGAVKHGIPMIDEAALVKLLEDNRG